jgi:hypothetical protein
MQRPGRTGGPATVDAVADASAAGDLPLAAVL